MLVGYVAATVDGHLALVPAGGHAVDPSEDDPGATYARMYAELAELLVERGARVHDVAIPAMTSIEDAWYDLGFGRRVCIASRSTLLPRARQPTSSDVRVREAGEDDMDAIARLSSMEVAYRARSPMFMAAVPPDLESVRASHLELAERGALHFLATLDGEPAGLLTLLRESRFQPISSEGGVFVGPTATDPRFWRRGVASALVWSALEWARRHDHRRIDVSYLSANLLSRRFWRHAGFATIGWRVERRLPGRRSRPADEHTGRGGAAIVSPLRRGGRARWWPERAGCPRRLGEARSGRRRVARGDRVGDVVQPLQHEIGRLEDVSGDGG